MTDNQTNNRKLEHIKIVLEQNVEPIPNVFDKYSLPYSALPEIDMDEIDTSFEFFRKKLSFPFLISSMTGGPQLGETINRNLAIGAQKAKVALALGSMRVIIKHPESAKSFQVRNLCPDIPLFANLGLIQLNYGFGIDEINKIIDITEVDGIFLHINHMQEAIQPEGDVNYKDLLPKLEKIINKIKVPVLAKEAGSGIDYKTAKRLYEIGVKWIDVSGLGGTNWALVEGYRGDLNLGELFGKVGIPTDKALIECNKIKDLNLIAGGGVRSGVDILKGMLLGAKLGTAAKPLLQPALESDEAVYNKLMSLNKEFRISMFAIGAKNIETLNKFKIEL